MTRTTVSMHAFYEHDSVEADGYLSRPTDPGPWPAVIVLHEWWGLDQHFRELSRRLAKEGFIVLVPDLYDGSVTSDPDEAARLKTSLDTHRAVEITTAAIPYLQSLPFVDEETGCGLVGFCMGGGLALLAAENDEFDALVAYFPSIYPDSEELRKIRPPTLLHYGLEDTITPRSEIDRITELIDEGGMEYQLYEYEGAGHAFMNDMHEEYYHADATEKAWPRTVEFLKERLHDTATAGVENDE